MTVRPSEEYERRARAEEESPAPFILKGTRVVTWIVYVVVVVDVIMLLLAFFLRLAGANPEAGFAAWVYRSADRSMDPFRGIFPTAELTGESVLDLSLLFAAIVYLVIAMLIHTLLLWLGRQLDDRQRRIAALRAAAQDSAAREYAAAQQLAVQQAFAQQAAAAALAAQQPITDTDTAAGPPAPGTGSTA